jgi:hypothetical protein
VIKVKKMFITSCSILLISSASHASMMDQLIYNVVGQVTNAAGARLGDEIYYGSSRQPQQQRQHRAHKPKTVKHKTAPAKRDYESIVTDEMRIQQALKGLGFYRGNIDGQVNSFETRTAIKEMNIAYGISESASLKPEAKDTLIFLGTLFGFDKHLISTDNTSREKDRKIQVSLKLHGYYQGNTDGAIGERTRNAIAQYKSENGMPQSRSLDFEEEYQLVSTAKVKNDKNIEDTIASLESMGTTRQGQMQQQSQNFTQQGQQTTQPMHQGQQAIQPMQQEQQQDQQVVQPVQQQGQQATQPMQQEQQATQPVQQQGQQIVQPIQQEQQAIQPVQQGNKQGQQVVQPVQQELVAQQPQ